MGFFTKLKRDKEDQRWLDGADFTECLELLFEGTPDEDMKRRLFLLQCSKKTRDIPESQSSVWATLLHYHRIVPLKMDIVASNIAHGVYYLIDEADERDPYTAKSLYERLFKKWPEAFHYAMRAAEKEELERNWVFLACVHLFGWAEDSDASRVKEYVDKIYALDQIKKYSVYEWLKAQIEK